MPLRPDIHNLGSHLSQKIYVQLAIIRQTGTYILFSISAYWQQTYKHDTMVSISPDTWDRTRAAALKPSKSLSYWHGQQSSRRWRLRLNWWQRESAQDVCMDDIEVNRNINHTCSFHIIYRVPIYCRVRGQRNWSWGKTTAQANRFYWRCPSRDMWSRFSKPWLQHNNGFPQICQ